MSSGIFSFEKYKKGNNFMFLVQMIHMIRVTMQM